MVEVGQPVLETWFGSIYVEEGAVVPVPKKKGKGICEVDNFRGIAVVSVLVVYKLMCSMAQSRLQIVEGDHLLAEEQGGF